MPLAPTDFSYSQDIQPYASKFFDRIDASTTLSHGAKMRIQGTLLGGMEDIETQRLKLQQERDEGRGRKLAYESGTFALENARADRARTEAQDSRRAGIAGIAKSILDSKDDPETKRQKLARTALDYADDDDALKTFGVAERALPAREKNDYTAMQIADMTSKMVGKVNPDLIPALMQNPAALGQVLGDIAKDEMDTERDRKLAADRTEQGLKLKDSLSEKPLNFYNPEKPAPEDYDKDNKSRIHDENGKPRWMDDESTVLAKRILHTLDGTPEEIEEFERLGKDSKSDRERYRLAENVRLRYQLARARGGAAGEGAAAPTKGGRWVRGDKGWVRMGE